MDLNKKLKELKPQQLNCNVFDVYSYNGLTMQDLLCQFFTTINECVKSTNDVIDLTDWLVNIGLEEEVVKKLMVLIEDGTVEKLINVNLFKTLNNEINGLSSQLEHKMNKNEGISVNQIDKNLGKIDQTYMTDEFLQQITGNTPIHATVANKSITIDKIAFNPVIGLHSNNIFNPKTIKLNTYIEEHTGNDTFFNNWFTSDYIIVTSETQYFINPVIEFTRVAFYDKDKVFISKIDSSSYFITPSNCCYIKIANVIQYLDLTYVNLANDKGYDDFGVFLDTNTIKESSVTKDKLAFNTIECEKTRNLFNKNTVELNKFLKEENGDTFEVSEYFVSDFIKVNKNENYYLNINNSEHCNICLYDKYKNFIKTFKGTKTIETDSNTYYVRLAHSVKGLNNLQFECGSEETSYQNFGLIPKDLAFDLQNTVKITDITSKLVLNNKILNIKLIGDSITQGVGGSNFNQDGEEIIPGWNVNTSGVCWGNMLKDYLESKFNCNIKNYGTSGVTSSFILEKIETLVKEDDDIIICCIGTNDRNVGNETLEQLYYNVKSIYNNISNKNKRIILMSNIPASVENETDINNPKKYHMEDVDNIYMKLANDLNIEYISLYKNFIEYCDIKNITIDSLLCDGIHPNDEGYKVMYKIICEKLGFGIKIDGATW